jgi:hypothetical protein
VARRIRDLILAEGWSDAARAYDGRPQPGVVPGQEPVEAELQRRGIELRRSEHLASRIDAADRLPPGRRSGPAIRDRLSDGDGFVHRMQPDGDGRAEEGTFTLCTCWMVECLARCGERAAATELFERVLARANDVGLLAEEFAPGGRSMLGNMPQAYSHVGLIAAAATLGETAERA